MCFSNCVNEIFLCALLFVTNIDVEVAKLINELDLDCIYDLHPADIFFALYEIRKRYNFYLPFSPLHLIIFLPPLSPSLPTTALQLCTLHSPLPGILTPVVISSDRVKEVSALTLRTRPIISTSQSSLNAWQAVNEPSRSFHGVQTREGLLNIVSRCEIRTLV